MFDTKTMKSSDEGVSPVIGVILMVAITVILAAVIGTFVLDLAGNLESSAQASVTFDETVTDADVPEVTAQAVSMQNADSIELESDGSGSWDSGNSPAVIEEVGTSKTYEASGSDASGTITAVGVLDGNSSVLQSYEYGA